jgi:ribosomal protein S18 acetylase RimI-like enzyme
MLQYKSVIYKNLTINQQNRINIFIKNNFPEIKSENLGLESNTIIILCLESNELVGLVCLLNNAILKSKLTENKISLDYYNICDENTHLDGMFIYNLCVDNEYRNKKIGYSLIKKCIDFITEYKIDYIHTQAQNEISRKLFIKNKFTENAEHKINNNIFYVLSKFI